MYWDVDGGGTVYCCLCCGDYRETKGDGITIGGEKELKAHAVTGTGDLSPCRG
jgi:hypothetical protein